MPRQMTVSSAAVATHHQHGATAGMQMLRDGGNAVDAAVAATIALCVVMPGAVGLGGYGGSAVIYLGKQRRVVAVDFDSRAALAFRAGMVTAEPESNYYGARAVTVPAVIAGLDLVLREFGTKTWSDASQPAIQLAEEGIELEWEHARHLRRCAPKIDSQSLRSLFPEGRPPELGGQWRQPNMARFLRRLAAEGPAAFYTGPIAQDIVRYLAERGGILTEDDFHSYRPQMVNPMSLHIHGLDYFTPPPPSGGVMSLAMMQTVEQFDAQNMEPWGARYFHLLAEATKLCWSERERHLGDPDVVSVPLEQLLSAESAAVRAAHIRSGELIRNHLPVNQSPHTANVVAIDAEQNLISLTATQGWQYGSHLVVDGMGLVLNHGMSRFDYTPGHPNAPAAGKRMQHNMSPTIALRDGRPALAIGLPGGPKIVNVTAQIALSMAKFGATPAEAIAAPRIHTVGDEPLLASPNLSEQVAFDLASMGHTMRREDDMGGPVNVIAIDAESGRIEIASGEEPGAVAGS